MKLSRKKAAWSKGYRFLAILYDLGLVKPEKYFDMAGEIDAIVHNITRDIATYDDYNDLKQLNGAGAYGL